MRRTFIITGIISLLMLGWPLTKVIRNYYIGNGKLMTRVDDMQRLLLFNRTSVANYDSAAATPHKMGDKYSYLAEGKTYYHVIELADPPQTQSFNIQYLPDNPDIQSIDPAKQLAAYRQRLIEKQEVPALSWVLIFVGLMGVVYSVYRLVKNN